MAGLGDVIPITRSILVPSIVGARVAVLTRGSAFLLESSGTARGGWEETGVSLLGFRPRGVWRAWGHRVEVVEAGVTTVTEEERPLESVFCRVGRRPRLPGLPGFSGGLVGYIGWGAVRWFEPRVPARLGPDPQFPDAELMIVDDLVALDTKHGTATLIANVEPACFADERAARRAGEERLDELERALAEKAKEAEPGSAEGAAGDQETDTWGRDGFESAVETVLGHLRAGDSMQTVLSRRVSVPFSGEPLDLYESLRTASPVPYHFFLRFEEPGSPVRAVLGASPELLVRVEEGKVLVRPIAGTRRRGATSEEDAANEAELRADPKERAEHVMLVDLGRNDVGRVVRPGSVTVDEREVVERFSHVMHLVSQVSGTLREGLTALDALAAAFPAGTVSGAPKVRALEIIDALEPVPRGPYGGAVGTVCYDGSLVMAIHLRSVALAGKELRLQAGAGIVSDSVPAHEFAETEAKLAAVRAALVRGRWRRW